MPLADDPPKSGATAAPDPEADMVRDERLRWEASLLEASPLELAPLRRSCEGRYFARFGYRALSDYSYTCFKYLEVLLRSQVDWSPPLSFAEASQSELRVCMDMRGLRKAERRHKQALNPITATPVLSLGSVIFETVRRAVRRSLESDSRGLKLGTFHFKFLEEQRSTLCISSNC